MLYPVKIEFADYVEGVPPVWQDWSDYLVDPPNVSKKVESENEGEAGVIVFDNAQVSFRYYLNNPIDIAFNQQTLSSKQRYLFRISAPKNDGTYIQEFEGMADFTSIKWSGSENVVSFNIIDKLSALGILSSKLAREFKSLKTDNPQLPPLNWSLGHYYIIYIRDDYLDRTRRLEIFKNIGSGEVHVDSGTTTPLFEAGSVLKMFDGTNEELVFVKERFFKPDYVGSPERDLAITPTDDSIITSLTGSYKIDNTSDDAYRTDNPAIKLKYNNDVFYSSNISNLVDSTAYTYPSKKVVSFKGEKILELLVDQAWVGITKIRKGFTSFSIPFEYWKQTINTNPFDSNPLEALKKLADTMQIYCYIDKAGNFVSQMKSAAGLKSGTQRILYEADILEKSKNYFYDKLVDGVTVNLKSWLVDPATGDYLVGSATVTKQLIPGVFIKPKNEIKKDVLTNVYTDNTQELLNQRAEAKANEILNFYGMRHESYNFKLHLNDNTINFDLLDYINYEGKDYFFTKIDLNLAERTIDLEAVSIEGFPYDLRQVIFGLSEVNSLGVSGGGTTTYITSSSGTGTSYIFNEPLYLLGGAVGLHITDNLKLTNGYLDAIQNIKRTDTPTFANLILTNATTLTTQAVRADRIIATNYPLTGGGNLTADRTLTLNYNSTNLKITANAINTIQDISPISTPIFPTIKLTNLNDNTIPYHINDSSGLGNSPITVAGNNIYIADEIRLPQSIEKRIGQFYDRSILPLLMNDKIDLFQHKPVLSLERWDGSAWVDWSENIEWFKRLISGYPSNTTLVDASIIPKFRAVIQANMFSNAGLLSIYQEYGSGDTKSYSVSLEGSTNQIDWVILLSDSIVSDGKYYSYKYVANTNSYTYFRLTITHNNSTQLYNWKYIKLISDRNNGQGGQLMCIPYAWDYYKNFILQGNLYNINGNATSPSFTFASDVNTGIFRIAEDTIGFATGGMERIRVDSAGRISLNGDINTYLYRPSTNELSFVINNLETIRLKNSNVGIKNTNPTEVLDVNGNIKAQTIKLTNLTDGYFPYHNSDSIGLVNSNMFTNGVNIGFATTILTERFNLNGNQKTWGDIYSDNFNGVDPYQGYYIGRNGSIFGKLTATELHVKNFIADLEFALAGSQIIAKSVAKIYEDCIVDVYSLLTVESFEGYSTMAVFQNGDTIRLRTMIRNGTGLSVTDYWVTVNLNLSYGVSGFNTTNNTQQYNITFLGSQPSLGTIVARKGQLALDYGTIGNGIIETVAVGPVGSKPFSQIAEWTSGTIPVMTVRERHGHLQGLTDPLFGALNGYGFYSNKLFLSSGNSSGISIFADSSTNSASLEARYNGNKILEYSTTTNRVKLGSNITSDTTTSFDFNAVNGQLRIGVIDYGKSYLYFDGTNLILSNEGYDVIKLDPVARSVTVGRTNQNHIVVNETNLKLNAGVNTKIQLNTDGSGFLQSGKIFWDATDTLTVGPFVLDSNKFYKANQFYIGGSSTKYLSTFEGVNRVLIGSYDVNNEVIKLIGNNINNFAQLAANRTSGNINLTVIGTTSTNRIGLVAGNMSWYGLGTDFGILFRDFTAGKNYFRLTETEKYIAGWNFDDTKLYATDVRLESSSSLKGLAVSSSGTDVVKVGDFTNVTESYGSTQVGTLGNWTIRQNSHDGSYTITGAGGNGEFSLVPSESGVYNQVTIKFYRSLSAAEVAGKTIRISFDSKQEENQYGSGQIKMLCGIWLQNHYEYITPKNFSQSVQTIPGSYQHFDFDFAVPNYATDANIEFYYLYNSVAEDPASFYIKNLTCSIYNRTITELNKLGLKVFSSPINSLILQNGKVEFNTNFVKTQNGIQIGNFRIIWRREYLDMTDTEYLRFQFWNGSSWVDKGYISSSGSNVRLN